MTTKPKKKSTAKKSAQHYPLLKGLDPKFNRFLLVAIVGLVAATGYLVVKYSHASTSGMQVQGNQILKDGAVFSPRGFNMIGVLSAPGCSNGAGVNAREHFNQNEMDVAKSWDANTLRLQVSQIGLSTTNSSALSSYLTQIENSVALAQSNGFTVILSMQDQSISCGKTHPLPSSATVTAWHNLAPHFASNTNVMFELFNEPQNNPDAAGWAQWLNGGSGPSSNEGDTPVGMQAIMNDIRSAGANNVVLVDAASLGEQAQGIPKLKESSGRGVIYAIHPYYYTEPNPQSAWDTRYGYLTTSVPVLATEWNYKSDKCATSGQTSAPTFLNYLEAHHIGVLGHALDAPGTLISGFSYAPTSCGSGTGGSGQVLKNYFSTLASANPTPKPTPTPKPSPTPKPTSTPKPTPTPTATPTPTPSPTPNSLTLVPSSDSYVVSSQPNTNYGNTDPLWATALYRRAFLRFKTDDTTPDGDIATSVTLKLHVTNNDATTGGFEVHPEDGSFVAKSVTWNNQPAWDTEVLATSATPKAGSWVSISLPLASIAEDGDTTLGIRYTVANSNTQFNSRENTSTPPELVIGYTSANPGDTTPPTAPSKLTAKLASGTTVNLGWSASTDNVSVSKYVVIRNGLAIASLGATVRSYSDTSTQAGVKYSYAVRAYDPSNNESPASNTVSVKTASPSTEDTTPPSAPTGLATTLVTATQINLAWNASTDNVGVTGYYVYQGGNKIATVPAPLTSFGEASLTGGTSYVFSVQAFDAAGNISANSNTLTVTTPTTAADPVVIAAGDISTGTTQGGNKLTSDLILNLKPNAVITMGDNQYDNGALADFKKYFAVTWGRFKSLIHPSPGHHEYYTDHTAAGYYTYFGAAANNPSQPNCTSSCEGYYSFNEGNWHLIALNTNHYLTSPLKVCAFVACDATSAQIAWLKQDLATNTKPCVLAYWADPRFTSGTTHGSNPNVGAIWNTLYAGHVDLALNGHEHLYERFAKQNPSGQVDPNGIREIIAGTGGNGPLYPFGKPIANSQIRSDASRGVLKLTLHADSYSWQFVPAEGSFTDFGTTACNR